MNEKMYCPMCEAERDFRRESRNEEYDVRGEKISLEVPRLVCGTCGEAIVDEEYGDPTLKLYSEYRRRHGLLSPDEIRAIRDRYSLSQDAFASLLGTSPATLARYEGGSLQDKAYDQLLRACENPGFMAELVEREGNKLSQRQLRDVRAALLGAQFSQALQAFPQCRHVNLRAYSGAVTWFCRRLQAIPQTKMCKLLFYADFVHYRRFRRSLTGAVYKRLQYGPVPCEFDLLRNLLEDQDIVEVNDVAYGPHLGLEYREGPASNRFAGLIEHDEERVLEFVVSQFGHMTAKDISDRSHQEPAWRETPPKCIISYQFADRLSVRLEDTGEHTGKP